MAIDRDEVRRVAELARLELAEGDVERVAAQLSAVLEFARQLEGLDLEGCEPASFAPEDGPPRADVPDGRQFAPGDATAGAPEGDHDFFLVPPVVEYLEP
jgi:aspartyl-tRNA(Asn)/glutamyl-tRNA(Gln) amidotransferase subunit C